MSHPAPRDSGTHEAQGHLFRDDGEADHDDRPARSRTARASPPGG